MAYVREKKVPGKDGTEYRYYQLVEGKRVDGKVKQRVISHLGKFDSIEEARAAAESLSHNIPKRHPDYIKELKELSVRWADNLRTYGPLIRELNDIYFRLKELKGVRSKAATAERKRLKERQAEFAVLYDGVDVAQARAEKIYDGLPPAAKKRVRDLAQKTGPETALITHILHKRESSALSAQRAREDAPI